MNSSRADKGLSSELLTPAPLSQVPAAMLSAWPEFSVVIPCYNEMGSIEETIQE